MPVGARLSSRRVNILFGQPSKHNGVASIGPTAVSIAAALKPCKPIYVEILIKGDIESVWRLTQTPDLHRRWDLRFSEIRYLPKHDSNQPQQFLYSTRIGMGLKIEGRGETVGERTGESGVRSSSLKFWSDDPKSLIREGAGYWKYCPEERGVRFLTLYDYSVRFGWFGVVLDRLLFRRIMGWATAWSFDRLRLWVETGIPPEAAFRFAAANAVARLALAFVWLWHGLVPKLLFHHSDEAAMLMDWGVATTPAQNGVTFAGIAEVLLGLWVVIRWRSYFPLGATVLLMLFALLGVIMQSPRFLIAPFNPVTLNTLMIIMASVAWIAQRYSPTASHCRRKRRGTESA